MPDLEASISLKSIAEYQPYFFYQYCTQNGQSLHGVLVILRTIGLTLPAVHGYCRLLTYLLINFGSLYCKPYEPRSDCSLRSSLIRVHSVFFHGPKKSEVHLNLDNRRKI